MTTSTVPSRALAPDVDPVRFEVIRNALLAITEEMGATLRRAAYSTNIKTRGDFSCAFFDRDLRTIAQAFAQPAHLGSLAHLVPRAIGAYWRAIALAESAGDAAQSTALASLWELGTIYVKHREVRRLGPIFDRY